MEGSFETSYLLSRQASSGVIHFGKNSATPPPRFPVPLAPLPACRPPLPGFGRPPPAARAGAAFVRDSVQWERRVRASVSTARFCIVCLTTNQAFRQK
jgi:hypothetical protein